MNGKKPCLDPGLTLPVLADMIYVPMNYLSFIINEIMGRNFYDNINFYRIEAVKKDIQDPANHLAFDAGFNSTSTFNSMFKKNTGLTPTEYGKCISEQAGKTQVAPAEDCVCQG